MKTQWFALSLFALSTSMALAQVVPSTTAVGRKEGGSNTGGSGGASEFVVKESSSALQVLKDHQAQAALTSDPAAAIEILSQGLVRAAFLGDQSAVRGLEILEAIKGFQNESATLGFLDADYDLVFHPQSEMTWFVKNFVRVKQGTVRVAYSEKIYLVMLEYVSKHVAQDTHSEEISSLNEKLMAHNQGNMAYYQNDTYAVNLTFPIIQRMTENTK